MACFRIMCIILHMYLDLWNFNANTILDFWTGNIEILHGVITAFSEVQYLSDSFTSAAGC